LTFEYRRVSLVSGMFMSKQTPMRVEKSRMIPVIHAKLFRTSTTEAVALVWLASSSRLEMCNADGASIMDPKNDEASSVDITSPTIFPV